MLSTRGSATTQTIISEALASCKAAGKILCVPEAERTWKAASAVIRQQVLLGHSIVIPRFGGFWAKQRHVATDGGNRYYVRQLKFGFAPGFVTTYNLDSMIAQMDSRTKFIKLPMDLVAQEANVPADVASAILHEIFLFVGEGIHKGRTFHINFDELVDIGVKKERALVTPNAQLETDFFTIDSRKWPSGVRSMAALQLEKDRVVARPGSATSTRPSSRGSSARPLSARSVNQQRPSSTAATLATPRPLFMTALPRDKTFKEIENMPIRQVMPLRKGPAAKKAAAKPQTRRVDPMSMQNLVDETEREEESVYDILSPPRQFPDEPIRKAAPLTHYQHHDDGFDCSPNQQGYSDESGMHHQHQQDTYYDEEPAYNPHHTTTTVAPPAVTQKKAEESHVLGSGSTALFPWEVKTDASHEEPIAPRTYGRKRFEGHREAVQRESAQSLLYDNMM